MTRRTPSRSPRRQLYRRLALSVALAASAFLTGCSTSAAQQAARMTGGDPERGQAAIQRYGCPACHTISGIAGAHGLVGPPLTGVASRVYLGGVLPNTPDNMIRWIRHPRQVDEKTAMPEMGVTAQDGRDIAAYLYTLR
jgi:cytochrome c